MYAIIVTGGKQYKVSQGDVIFIEKLNVNADDELKFDCIALGGDELILGEAAKKAVITGRVIKNGKGKKIRVFKYKAKKNYRRTKGHRQPYTKVEITGITA